MEKEIEQLKKEKEHLLNVMYKITEAESPEDMYQYAEDALKEFDKDVAPLH